MIPRAKVTLIAAALVACAVPLAADEAAQASRDIAGLLDIGWDPSGKALSAAGDEYAKLHSQAPGDTRLQYAFALVQLKHRRYQNATRLIDEAMAADPGDLALRRAKVWLLMLTKKHDGALVQMSALAEAVAPATDAGPSDADAAALRQQLAGFLGRMFGFLEGPAGSAVDADRLAEQRGKVVGTLGTGLEKEFEAGRRAVLEKYDELSLRHEQAQETAKVDQQEEKVRLGEQLETEQTDIDAQQKDLQQQADQAQTSLEATLRDIDPKLAALESDFSRLAAAAAPVHDQMAGLDRRIGRLLDAASTADDPAEAARLRREADRLSSVYGQYEQQYNQLDAEARRVRAQRDALAAERRAAEERYQDEIDRLEKQGGRLLKTEKRIAQDRKKTSQPSTGATPKVRSLSAQATAFTTYDPFPLEQEKERLLK